MLDLIATKLDELNNIQKQLLDYAERKKIILIERKIDELNQMVQEEVKLVKQLNQLENERAQLVDSILEDHRNLTFSQFVEQISDDRTRLSLRKQMKTLQELSEELQRKNKLNERILKDSMSFVQQMIDQVTKSQQQQFNYKSPLDQQKSQTSTSSRGFFDTRA